MFVKLLAVVGVFVLLISLGFANILYRNSTGTANRNRIVFFAAGGSLTSILFFFSYLVWQDLFLKFLSNAIRDDGYTITIIITVLLCFFVHFCIMSILNMLLDRQRRKTSIIDYKNMVMTALYSLIVTAFLETIFVFLHVT